MGKIIIVGHKNPDTDSIVSAIAMQEYFKNILGKDALACRAGELNNETKFVLQRFNIEHPPLIGEMSIEDRIALVDHNETTQTFEGLDYSKVDFIFDHHKLSLATEKPIFLRNEPIGSTASLISKMFHERDYEISPDTAKLLLAGILSDTLNLTSPTTTSEDKEILSQLNKKAGLDLQRFANDMFEAKSSLAGISVDDLINLDYKIYELGKNKVGAGTWETTSPNAVNEKKGDILKLLRLKKDAEGLDYLFFMVVDILKQNCQLYIISDTEKSLAEKVFGGKTEGEIMILEGVVSRKKQIIPQLTEALTK